MKGNRKADRKLKAQKNRRDTAAALKGGQIVAMGLEQGPAVGVALTVYQELEREVGPEEAMGRLEAVIKDPLSYKDDARLGGLAEAIAEQRQARASYQPRQELAPAAVFGEGLDPAALDQLKNAVSLPVAVAGALMPDAHVGYGLPIGGVLATDNSVIPYAVGVDIACRMRLTIFEAPSSIIDDEHQRLCEIIERETLFGTGQEFRRPHDHPVMDREKWQISDVVRGVRDRAAGQLGTSGSGNHFVSFDNITIARDYPELSLKAGSYLCVLSHSGSRGAGARIADHYSKLAMQLHPELPPELRRLAWLDMDSEAGQEYWEAMNLMGEYAAANHALIHEKIERALGIGVVSTIENHHNFAWKQEVNGQEAYVHRKGATPAGTDVLGVIPGSMAAPGYLVRGKGEATSLLSASHGAGRAMSRTEAKKRFNWPQVQQMLTERGVTLLSAGLDEAPGAYKDIDEVMASQTELVEPIARFDPRIVKMAPAGEKPED